MLYTVLGNITDQNRLCILRHSMM